MGIEIERLIFYSSLLNMAGVILYYTLNDVDSIFYIDVGSSDPFSDSDTKMLYDMKNACGINEPQKYLWKIANKDRLRDINLCIALAESEGSPRLYVQG